MNSKFINALVFIAGAAVGSVVTWKIVRNKYEQIVQEEIESIKEAFTDSTIETTEDTDVVVEIEESDDGECDNDYATLVKNYTNGREVVKDMGSEPKVISPYDFGELDNYNQFELTYYADGIVEDEDYNIVENVEEIIGPDALGSFGEYEDDAVFVRNDKLRSDFQILKDPRTYDEARSIGGRYGV